MSSPCLISFLCTHRIKKTHSGRPAYDKSLATSRRLKMLAMRSSLGEPTVILTQNAKLITCNSPLVNNSWLIYHYRVFVGYSYLKTKTLRKRLTLSTIPPHTLLQVACQPFLFLQSHDSIHTKNKFQFRYRPSRTPKHTNKLPDSAGRGSGTNDKAGSVSIFYRFVNQGKLCWVGGIPLSIQFGLGYRNFKGAC